MESFPPDWDSEIVKKYGICSGAVRENTNLAGCFDESL